MQYLLLLYTSYETDDLVTIRTASAPLILGTTTVDPRIVARGRSRSGPFKWHWSIVTVESLSLDATTSKQLKVFPFLQSNATTTEQPVVMPWRLLATPPPWIEYFSLGAYHNATGYGPVEILSSPEANSLAGYADLMAPSGIEYSQCLSFYNDDQHPGWRPGVKLRDMPEYLVADNFDVTSQNFLIFTGKSSGDLFEYDTSSWPKTISDASYGSQTTSPGGPMQTPWMSIIAFILSFILSKKSGKSTAAAALTGLAAAGTTYLLADPTNPDNLFGIGVNSSSTAPGTTPPATTTPSGSTGAGSLGQAIGGAVNSAGNAISNMGPGTAALVGGAAGVALAGKSSWLLWGGLAVGAYLLLKD